MSDFYRQQRHIVTSSSLDHYDSLAIYVFSPGGQEKVLRCFKKSTYPTNGSLSNSQHPEHFNCLKTLIAPTLLQMDKHAHAQYPFVGPHLAHISPCKINSDIRHWSYNPTNFIATNNGDEPYWLCWVCENAICRRSSR